MQPSGMRRLERPARRLPHWNRRRFTLLIGTACTAWADLACGQPAAPPAPAVARIEQPAAPVAFETVRPGPPTPLSPTAAPVPDKLPDLTAVSGWSIPPIRWGGSTTSNYNWNDSSASRTFNETQTLNLRASSYVYQPWYAQVSGNVGLLSGNARLSSDQSAATTTSRNTALTYGGNLALFPQSRFPFQAYLQTSDSRARANAMGAHSTAIRMGARQSYRPQTGPETYSASADRSIVTAGSVRSVVDALQGAYATTITDHSVSTSARFSRNSGDIGGQGSNLLNLSGSHSWRADEEFTVASSASYMRNQTRMLTGTGLSMNNSQIVQAGSAVTWLPDEELPLTVSGGANILHMTTETEAAKGQLSNLSSYANANYRFSENLSAAAGLTLAQSQGNGISQFSSGQNASLSYSGNPLVFGNYSYNWGTGAGITNQVITGGAANRNVSGQIQHSVLRSVKLATTSVLVLNASQGYSVAQSNGTGQSGVLTHAGGGSLRLAVGEDTMGMLNATVSDSISTGQFPSHFRSLSTQGNMQMQLSSRSTLTANLNFIVNQQLTAPMAVQTVTPTLPTTAATTSNGSTTMNGAGQLSYAHRSPFNISNLIYSAMLQANASQTNIRLQAGDGTALGWQTGNVFQHNADYRLGRLVFRLTNSFATLNGKKNASLFLMMSREIGDF